MAQLVATPDNLLDDVAKTIVRLDEQCFPGDFRVGVNNTWWWIARDKKNRPIAYSGLRKCLQPYNKGYGYLCRAGVLPKFRGNGIQKTMIHARVKYAKFLGLKAVVTYVAPDNLASANSLIGCGFKLYHPVYRWGGKDCFYFRRVLEE